MTYKVPDWDDASNALIAFDDTAILCHLKNGGTDLRQHQSQHLYLQQRHHSALHTDSAAAPVPNASDAMADSLTLPGVQKPSDKFESSDLRSPNPSLSIAANACVQEDEMLSWLRYPLEDSLDRNYCSDVFGELLNPHVQLVRDVFLHQSMKDSGTIHVPSNPVSGVRCQEAGHAAGTIASTKAGMKSDAAMALGAGRAAGVLSQAGSEAFKGVRTHLTPCNLLKPSSSPAIESSSDGIVTNLVANPLPRVTATSSGTNFSLFSRPLATTMDNLRVVGVASGPTSTERARQPPLKELQRPCDPFAVESGMSSFQPSTDFISQGRAESVGNSFRDWCSPSSLPSGPISLNHTEMTEPNSHLSCVSGTDTVLEASEAIEATASPSCLSGSSFEMATPEVIVHPQKKLSLARFPESQVVDDAAANARKPPSGPRASKRSRASEVHNESEKKRRNKINVKLKLLQSLIPNSNKMDKASVLDEAIEYTKMLQAQLQFMSSKSGLFSPTMIQSGMQLVPLEQQSMFPHWGMGAGMPIGMHVDMGIGLPVLNPNPANAIRAGFGIAATTCAGAGAAVNVSPTLHQVLSHPCAGTSVGQMKLLSPTYDVSSVLPMACEPLRVAVTQQPLQPILINGPLTANLYNTSQQ